VQLDLATAGIAKADEQGRTVDFHALRYTFATNLHRSGVSSRIAQQLMRHTDPRLTANIYTDAQALDTAHAVNRLPRLGPNDAAGDACDLGNRCLCTSLSDSELDRLVAAWPRISRPLRAAILGLIAAASTRGQGIESTQI